MKPHHFHASHPDPADGDSYRKWREKVMQAIVNADFTPLDMSPVFIGGWMGDLGRVQIGRVQSSGGISRRRQTLTDDADDRFNLIVPRRAGGVEVRQNNWARSVGPDGICMVRMDEPAEVAFERGHDAWLLFLPKREIIARVPRFCERDAHRALNSGPSADLLRAYLAYIETGCGRPAGRADAIMAGHLADLVVLCLHENGDNREAARTGGIAALRLRAIRAYIADNARNPNASLTDCAAATGLSRSYVQHVLESAGTSFVAELKVTRISLACFMLARPECARMSVADIAFASGFSDLSTFNRSFRTTLSRTPSEFRREAKACPAN